MERKNVLRALEVSRVLTVLTETVFVCNSKSIYCATPKQSQFLMSVLSEHCSNLNFDLHVSTEAQRNAKNIEVIN